MLFFLFPFFLFFFLFGNGAGAIKFYIPRRGQATKSHFSVNNCLSFMICVWAEVMRWVVLIFLSLRVIM